MTYDIKLDLVFNTLDFDTLMQAVEDNYLVRKGVTTLIDCINRFSIVIYDPVKKEWKDQDKVIDTTSRSTLLPFSIAKIRHYIALNGCCSDEYTALFKDKISSIVNAYILAMTPVVTQRRIDQLEADLAPLQQLQQDALNAALEIPVDTHLERLKQDVSDKNEQKAALEKNIQDLTGFQSKLSQSVSDVANLWGFLNKSNEDRRVELIKIAKSQNVYVNELKSVNDVGLTLAAASARLQNVIADEISLDQEILAREHQNAQNQLTRELTALRNLAAITRQITDIRDQLADSRK